MLYDVPLVYCYITYDRLLCLLHVCTLRTTYSMDQCHTDFFCMPWKKKYTKGCCYSYWEWSDYCCVLCTHIAQWFRQNKSTENDIISSHHFFAFFRIFSEFRWIDKPIEMHEKKTNANAAIGGRNTPIRRYIIQYSYISCLRKGVHVVECSRDWYNIIHSLANWSRQLGYFIFIFYY